MKQTRQAVHAVKQSLLLRCLCSSTTVLAAKMRTISNEHSIYIRFPCLPPIGNFPTPWTWCSFSRDFLVRRKINLETNCCRQILVLWSRLKLVSEANVVNCLQWRPGALAVKLYGFVMLSRFRNEQVFIHCILLTSFWNY